MALELRLQQWRSEEHYPVYNIVTKAPVEPGKKVTLYLTPWPPRENNENDDNVIALEGETLDDALLKVYQEALARAEVEEGEPFLGWPVYFISQAAVEAGGDNFFGYEPFVAHPISLEMLLKFAKMYTVPIEEKKRKIFPNVE